MPARTGKGTYLTTGAKNNNTRIKNTPFIIDKFIKNKANEVFKFKSGIDLVKKKSNKNIKTA